MSRLKPSNNINIIILVANGLSNIDHVNDEVDIFPIIVENIIVISNKGGLVN